MKEKILAQLKAKYPGAPKKVLELRAEKLAAKVTKEEDIEGAIGELETATIPFSEQLSELQQEGDRRIASAKKEWEKKNPPKPADDDEDDADDSEPAGRKKKKPVDDDDKPPKWANSLFERLGNYEKKEKETAIREKIKASEKLKSVPASYYQGWQIPEKEEDVDTWAENVSKSYETFVQDQTNAGFVVAHKPFGSQKTDAGITTGVQDYINTKNGKTPEAAAFEGKKL